MKTNNWDIPVAFYFQVLIQNGDFAFKEVSGLSTEFETETIVEGGNNDYVHVVPKNVKHGNLVLKRALKPVKKDDVVWLSSFFYGLKFPISTVSITINLLQRDGTPVYSWNCENAYPVKWEVDGLDAEKNSVLIETIELAYSKIERVPCR
jgi:phage tail-like protein